MKLIRTQDAVGMVLPHDITRIVKGVVKDTPFRKGHVITEEDIPLLLSLGKDHIYIFEKDESMLHENEAAEILRSIFIGPHMHASEVKEGKIEIIADTDGLFLVDIEKLRKINSLSQMMAATISSGFRVRKGDRLCGTRIIPLVIKKELMDEAVQIAGPEPLLKIIPYHSRTFAVVTTGNEVFYKRIEDTFTPVIEEKLAEYSCRMIAHEITDDDDSHIKKAIEKAAASGAEMIFCTGGMSVDPDDRTPLAIKNTGAKIISYGAPVLPGSMFLISYLPDGRPLCGLPGCVMYSKRTIFDLVLMRLIADYPVTPEYLAGLGHGGLCLNCAVCTFPSCGFGKGV